jgi:L-threonylcarbamoyladenylate synthase
MSPTPDQPLQPTRILTPDADGIALAANLLRAGELVALPTETVYGLAADATNPQAVAAIYAAKGRPMANPLIVHLPDVAAANALADLGAVGHLLSDSFWPGPLTLVAPLRTGHDLAPAVTAGLDTVALRVPAHPVMQGVLTALGRPVAAPSANPSGRISPVTAAHVLAGLTGRIAAVLDAGPCAVGLESSIVAVDGPRLLRAGGVSLEALEAALGHPLTAAVEGGPLLAPGMLPSHYAPRARVRLGVTRPNPGEVWIGFGPDSQGDPGLNLSPQCDPDEAAARLFHALHEADHRAGETGRIAVAPIPERGLGRAINDRLRRAAAPR